MKTLFFLWLVGSALFRVVLVFWPADQSKQYRRPLWWCGLCDAGDLPHLVGACENCTGDHHTVKCQGLKWQEPTDGNTEERGR